MEVQARTPFESHGALYGTTERTPYLAGIMSFGGEDIGESHVDYPIPNKVARRYNGSESSSRFLSVSVARVGDVADQIETRYDSDNSYSHPSSRHYAGVVASHSPNSAHSPPVVPSEQHKTMDMSVRRARSGPTTQKEHVDDDVMDMRELQQTSRWVNTHENYNEGYAAGKPSDHSDGADYKGYHERDGTVNGVAGNEHEGNREEYGRLHEPYDTDFRRPRETHWREEYYDGDRHVQYSDDEWERDLEGYGRYENPEDGIGALHGQQDHEKGYAYDEMQTLRNVEYPYEGRDEYKYGAYRENGEHVSRPRSERPYPSILRNGQFASGRLSHGTPDYSPHREHDEFKRKESSKLPPYEGSPQACISPERRVGSPFVARARVSSPHPYDGRYTRSAAYSAPYAHAERPFRSQSSFDEHWDAPQRRPLLVRSPETAAEWARMRDELPSRRPVFSSSTARPPSQNKAGGRGDYRHSEPYGAAYESNSQSYSAPLPTRPDFDGADLHGLASGTKSSGSNGVMTNSGNEDEKVRESRRHKGNRPMRRCLWTGPGGCNITEATHKTQWRKGPEGPGTLCNKHGLQYKYPSDKARRNETRRKTYAERKRHDDGSGKVRAVGMMFQGRPQGMGSMHHREYQESGSDSGPLYYN